MTSDDEPYAMVVGHFAVTRWAWSMLCLRQSWGLLLVMAAAHGPILLPLGAA